MPLYTATQLCDLIISSPRGERIHTDFSPVDPTLLFALMSSKYMTNES